MKSFLCTNISYSEISSFKRFCHWMNWKLSVWRNFITRSWDNFGAARDKTFVKMMNFPFQWSQCRNKWSERYICTATLCGLVTPYAFMALGHHWSRQIHWWLVRFGWGNGLLLDSTKPLTQPKLTNYQEVLWYSFEGNFRGNSCLWYEFEDY